MMLLRTVFPPRVSPFPFRSPAVHLRQVSPPFQSRVPLGLFLTLTVGSGIAYYVTEIFEKSHKTQLEAVTQLPQVVPSLDLEAATARLRQCEHVERVGGRTFHRVRLGSNSPIEDEYIEGTAPGPGGEAWEFWGVFDGHVGSATSILLRQALIPHVSNSLKPLTTTSSTNAIVASIKQAFLSIDKKIFKAAEAALESTTPSPSVIAALAPAYAGSCALLSLYNPRTSLLLTACVGDSRAVLGRYDSTTSTYTCEPLSIDQTGKNPKELARVRAAHPDEPDCIKEDTGRVLGLAVTRAFGDSRWKWDAATQRKAMERFFGDRPLKDSKTPPYLTSEPEVTETRVREGDFLIMASDGLWDHFSSEDAVACVGEWVKVTGEKMVKVQEGPDPGFRKSTTYVRDEEKEYVDWKATPEHFVVEDANVATHLARNALGGSRRDLFCGVMGAQPPLSRTARDDITVTVVFF